MIVDIFCHHISKLVGQNSKYFGGGKEFPYPVQNEDPEVRLGVMDKYGVDIQALSQTAPILLGFGPEEAAEICKLSNSDNYALCRQYPKRFVNICILSLLDIKSAMRELDRSINELDCRGITIASNQNGNGLDSPEYFPLYEKVVKHDLPIFIHPTNWESYSLVDMDKGWRMMHVFGWPFDTTQAVWRLIFGGVIDLFPSLRIVIHHMGALLPYFEQRIKNTFNRFLKDKLSRHISEYWGNFYGDTATDGTVATYPLGYAFFGPDRMMFGTDYPFGAEAGEYFVRANLAGLKSMNIPAEDMEKLLGGNARKLLNIK